MNSSVTAGDEIILARGAGSIIGGTARAGKRITARRLGSPGETPTHLAVGIDLDTYKAMQEIDRRIVELTAIAAQITEILTAAQNRNTENISPDQQLKITKLGEKLDTVNKQILVYQQQRDKKLEATVKATDGMVSVDREVFERVSISIGRYTRTEKLSLRRVKYFIKDYEIHAGKL